MPSVTVVFAKADLQADNVLEMVNRLPEVIPPNPEGVQFHAIRQADSETLRTLVSSLRQVDNEAGTFANRALRFDAAAVRVDDRANKTQTQPEAALRAALITAIETLPDTRNFFSGDSGAGVSDCDDNVIGARFRKCFYATAGR